MAEISRKVTGDTGFARQCEELADEVEDAVKKYATRSIRITGVFTLLRRMVSVVVI